MNGSDKTQNTGYEIALGLTWLAHNARLPRSPMERRPVRLVSYPCDFFFTYQLTIISVCEINT